jgi:hypothetical protein
VVSDSSWEVSPTHDGTGPVRLAPSARFGTAGSAPRSAGETQDLVYLWPSSAMACGVTRRARSHGAIFRMPSGRRHGPNGKRRRCFTMKIVDIECPVARVNAVVCYSVTGSRLSARNTCVPWYSNGSPVSVRLGKRATSVANATCPSSRASDAPTQKWVP